MEKKKMLEIIKKRSAVLLASCAYFASLIAANSSCGVPFYEPEQPEEVKKLKLHH